MSSGRPTAPDRGQRRVVVDALAEQPLALGLAQHRRVDEPGRDRVDGDPLGAELERQRLGEADHARLGRHVVGHEGLAAVGARRRDVDDPAPAGGDHVGQDGLAAVERAGEVDLEDAVPRVGVDLEERAEAVEAGVVDEHRRCAERRADLVDRGVESGPVGHVHGEADGRAAGGDDLGRRVVGGVAVAVEHRHRQAVGGEPLGDGEADARAAPGDDGRALGARRVLRSLTGSARRRRRSCGACRGASSGRRGTPGGARRGCPR